MTFQEWLPVASICVLGAMTPGPSLATVLQHTIENGRTHGIACGVAHALGIGVYALLTVFGLAYLITSHAGLFQGITILGALYLTYLGIRSIRTRATPVEDPLISATASTSNSLWKAAADGLSITLFNPKILLFFTALFSQFIHVDHTLGDRLIYSATAVVIDGGWYSLVALLLSQARILQKLQRYQHWIHRICGVLFVIIALRILTTI